MPLLQEMDRKFREIWIDIEQKAFLEEVNADVTFVVDGEEVKANRRQLEKHSDVFKTLFDNGFEKTGGRFKIKQDELTVITVDGKDIHMNRSQLANVFNLESETMSFDVRQKLKQSL